MHLTRKQKGVKSAEKKTTRMSYEVKEILIVEKYHKQVRDVNNGYSNPEQQEKHVSVNEFRWGHLLEEERS